MEGKYTRTLIKAKQPVTCCFVCSSTTLDFSNSSLTDEELKEIVSVCPNLTKLDLYGTNISNAGLAHISGLTSLTTLYLPENIDDDGLAHISGLTNLTTLYLRYANIGDAGLAHISGLTNLTTLDLHYTKVSDAGLAHISGLTNLITLDLPESISDAGRKLWNELLESHRKTAEIAAQIAQLSSAA